MLNKDEVLKMMYAAAVKISGKNSLNWCRALEDEIWDLCSAFNSASLDDEIFMCEHEDENGNIDGFYIEDDFFLTQI